jgi:hypothetical protein
VEAALNSDTPRSVCAAPSAWPQLLARLRKKTAALVIMLGFAGNIHRHKEHTMASKAQEKEPPPGVGPQTRPPKRQAERCQHLAALQIPHRCQERGKSRSGWRQSQSHRTVPNKQSVLDTIADKGIFHKNKAARDKSRLSAKVKALALAAMHGNA